MTFTEILSSEFMCLKEKSGVLQKIFFFLKKTVKYQKKKRKGYSYVEHIFINALQVSFMHGKWILKIKTRM